MPRKDGFETLEEPRQFKQAPVIMLTACSKEYNKLLGFHLGADDHVSKSFSPKESLMTRVSAVLKRTGEQRQIASLAFDGLTIQPKARLVTIYR